MLQLVGQHAQCQRLRCGKSLLAGRSIDQDSRKVNDLGDPAAVFFALQLDGQSHLFEASTFVHRERVPADVRYDSLSSAYPALTSIQPQSG